ncbi:MAG: murein biosynthesis integral membrane protein MurJ [Aggregatilineales bacterium]
MKALIRPMLIVTLFGTAAQAITFVIQVVVAGQFGATAATDALLAANTLPQYAITIFSGALAVTIIPIFLERAANGGETQAWLLASDTLTASGLALGILSLAGMALSASLIHLTAPGLAPETATLAGQLAIISWPSVFFTGLFSLLAALSQAQNRFAWPAVVSLLGDILNLTLVLVFIHPLGIAGVVVATTLNAVFQLLLLGRVFVGHYRFRLNWRNSGVGAVLGLALPLLLSGIADRWTPVIDRYLISGLPTGNIARLSYAFQLVQLAALFVSTGIGAVIFPRLAASVAAHDLPELRRTTSLSLRVMWLLVAPIVTIGVALAFPIVMILFARGKFSAVDAEAVASLLRIYLLAFAGGMTLGNVTSRTLYALKATRLVAIGGVLQSLFYVAYTAVLVSVFGVAGAALGYVLLFDGSLLWQLLFIRRMTGGTGGRTTVSSFLRTALASLVGGGLAWFVAELSSNPWIQLVFGGVVGLIGYTAILFLSGSPEARLCRNVALDYATPTIHRISAILRA